MTDTSVAEAEAPTTAPSTMLRIPIKNAAGFVEIDTNAVPQEYYEAALLEGFKALVHKNMTKVTKANIPDDAARKAETLTIAQKNVEEMMNRTFKLGRSKASATGVSGAVKTEAMRIARAMVKDEMKRRKIKVSHVAASEITKYAKELVDSDPAIVKQATENLQARLAAPVSKLINVSKIKTDPAKVKAAEAKAAKAKASAAGQLSAKQAGQVKPKAKGKGGAQANA